MIYQCYECNKLFDEDDGAIVISETISVISVFSIPIPQPFMVFKCKNCIKADKRKIIDKIQNERKENEK